MVTGGRQATGAARALSPRMDATSRLMNMTFRHLALKNGARGLRVAFAAIALTACGGSLSQAGEASWPPLGLKWFERGSESYRNGDIEDANLAVEQALRIVPDEDKVKLLAARVALARLELEQAIKVLERVAGRRGSGFAGSCVLVFRTNCSGGR